MSEYKGDSEKVGRGVNPGFQDLKLRNGPRNATPDPDVEAQSVKGKEERPWGETKRSYGTKSCSLPVSVTSTGRV